MKILFIYPSVWGQDNRSILSKYYNLSILLIDFSNNLIFPSLAAVTDKKHMIKMIDQRYEKIDYSKKYDLAGITATTPLANNAYHIADKLREKGVSVVLGGLHPSALPEEAKQHADAVVIGEAEDTWPQLLNDFENGTLKPFYRQEKPVDLNNLKKPRRDIIDDKPIDRKLKDVRVQASRGCPNRCRYCTITDSIHRIFRTRPVIDVIEEIESMPQKVVRFSDSSLTLNPVYAKELFKSMIGLGKKIYCNGNVNVLCRDDELLKLANEAGCVEWLVGFESVSQESLNWIGKTTNNVKDYKKAVRKIHDYNMLIEGNFIFGFDKDYLDIFDLTSDFINDAEVDHSNFFTLKPYPGTPLYEQFDRDGRILTKDWSQYTLDGGVVIQPKNMTPEQLLKGTLGIRKTQKAKKRVYSRSIKKLKLYGAGYTKTYLTKMLISTVRYNL